MIDLRTSKRIHIVGIGGAGMSAIAEVLVGSGHTVSGSDMASSTILERLTSRGAAVAVGHQAANLDLLPGGVDVDAVAHSTAIPPSNPELIEAAGRGIPVLSRADILTEITKAWQTIAVAGTHGKTTTSAMLTAALDGSGLDPAYIVGGDLRDRQRGAAVGSGRLLVVEADESDGTFIRLDAQSVIVTNVEPDHLEHYGGFQRLEEAFVQFVTDAPGARVLCADDPGSARLAGLTAEFEPWTYGTDPSATWRIVDPLPTPTGVSFSVDGPVGRFDIRLRQPGMHNARNATAALAAAVAAGAEPGAAAEALSAFGGVGRRFEPRGEADGVTLIDDYAHLPTEVEAALAAARSLEPGRVVAAFQPHRYSRTEQLWSTFGDAFVAADVLFVTGIYSSGEAPRPGISGRLIADLVAKTHPDADVRYVEELSDLAPAMVAELKPGDLCITLGAGDLTTVPDLILQGLEQR
jgi:UDP-N-acetylmuramate--alanine ligase